MSEEGRARESGFMDMEAHARNRRRMVEDNNAVAEVLKALHPASREFIQTMFKPYLYPVEWVKATAASVEQFRAAARSEGEAAGLEKQARQLRDAYEEGFADAKAAAGYPEIYSEEWWPHCDTLKLAIVIRARAAGGGQ